MEVAKLDGQQSEGGLHLLYLILGGWDLDIFFSQSVWSNGDSD